MHLLHAPVCDVIDQWWGIHTDSSLLNASSIVYGSTGTVQISLRLIHKIKKVVTIVKFVLNVLYLNNSSFQAHRKTCVGSGLLCLLVLPPRVTLVRSPALPCPSIMKRDGRRPNSNNHGYSSCNHGRHHQHKVAQCPNHTCFSMLLKTPPA